MAKCDACGGHLMGDYFDHKPGCFNVAANRKPLSLRPTPEPWTVQVNDLIGGWIVTTVPKPLSENSRQYIICECISEQDAQRIADALNGT